jgi:hypothetical protein
MTAGVNTVNWDSFEDLQKVCPEVLDQPTAARTAHTLTGLTVQGHSLVCPLRSSPTNAKSLTGG